MKATWSSRTLKTVNEGETWNVDIISSVSEESVVDDGSRAVVIRGHKLCLIL